MEWRILDQKTAQRTWNTMLTTFEDVNIFQSFEWGEYARRLLGAQPYRWIAVDDTGAIAAMFQGVLVRRYRNFGIIIGLGGPIGNLDLSLQSLHQNIVGTLHLSSCYCRIYPRRQYNVKDALLLQTHNWQRVLHPSGSGLSMWLDLTKTKEELYSTCSKNWRHNLRRACNNNHLTIQRWNDPNPDHIVSVYRSMESFKNVEIDYSRARIQHTLEVFKNSVLMYRCIDHNGDTLSVRGCITTGSYGVDWFAATTATGRTTYASYALLWEVILACRERGITFYDLNGVDPYRGAGVYNFKKGIGALPLEYLGEWDWATSESVRLLMNLAFRTRMSLQKKIALLSNYFPSSIRRKI
jgi:hypothetical protein